MPEITQQLTEVASDQKVIINRLDNHEKLLEKTSDAMEITAEKLGEIGTTILRLTVTVEQHEQRSTTLETEFKADRSRIEALERNNIAIEAAKSAVATKSESVAKYVAYGFTIIMGVGSFIWTVYGLLKKIGM